MFVVISTLISLGILTVIYYVANNQEQNVSRKYQLLSLLREILNLCRRYRTVTHKTLSGSNHHNAEIKHIESQLDIKLEKLIATAHMDNKPTYRILQIDIMRLISDWEEHSVARNQSEHGRVIRSCMYAMDEIAMAWLVEEKQERMAEHYHQSWQALVDGLETLTQFRICIQELNQPHGKERVEHYSAVMLKRLNTLSIMNPEYASCAASARAKSHLSGFAHEKLSALDEVELYDISSDISLALFNTYDSILAEMIDEIYFPLPKITQATITDS